MSTESYALYDHLFNWDTGKNLSNIEKHGVSFKEAATVFLGMDMLELDEDERKALEKYMEANKAYANQ